MSDSVHNTRRKRKNSDTSQIGGLATTVADEKRNQGRNVQGKFTAAGPSQQNAGSSGEPKNPPTRQRKKSVRPPTPSNSESESMGSEVGSLGDRIVEAATKVPKSPLPPAKKLRPERKSSAVVTVTAIETPIRRISPPACASNESTVVVSDSSEDDSEVEIIPNDSQREEPIEESVNSTTTTAATSEIRSPTQDVIGVSTSAYSSGFIVTHESGRKFVVIGDIRSTGRSSQVTLLLPVQSSYYQGQRVRKYLGPGGTRNDLEDLCVASTSRGNQTEEIDHSEGAETDHRASATDNQREVGEGQAGENITGPEGNAENEGVDNTAPENNENETEESSGSEDMADEDAVEGKSGCSVM